MSVFKAYDIRGLFPEEINEELAYKFGRAFVTFLNCKEVVVGYDMRSSSEVLCSALIKGIIDQGAKVYNIGLASTPMLYFAAKDKEAAIMITASHNPGEFNGFKLCRNNAMPISGETGIKEIEKLIENPFVEVEKGEEIKLNIIDKFIEHNMNFFNENNLKIVFDFGNAIGAYSHKLIWDKLNFTKIYMYDELDGNFPNHIPDPLNLDNVKDLQKKVVEENADFGVAIDGDADRCVFIDEKGQYISSDLITALIAKEILSNNPGEKILYDLRSSKSVKEVIRENKGFPVKSRVGHSFIKSQMREENSIFAGELSGHFYYRDSFFTESSIITVMKIMNLVKDNSLSRLIQPIKRYFSSGEINSDVEDKETKMKEIESKFSSAKNILWLDGLTVEFEDWWFNLRPSNTENKLRLNLEANSQILMEQKRDEVLSMVRNIIKT